MWLKNLLENRFELKTAAIGMGPEDVKEAKVLNRVMRVDKEGWYLEADQRQSELIIRDLSLERANAVGNLGEDDKP